MTDTEHDTHRDTEHDRRAPLVPGWEAANLAARQVGAVVSHGDQLLCYTRRTLTQLHAPARTVALALGFGLAVWAGATLRLGWPEPRAWIAGLATAVVAAILITVTAVIALRAEPRRGVDLILAPDPADLHMGTAGGGLTRRDVEASVHLAACESRAAGRLVLDTSTATRPAAMRPEAVHQLLDAALSRVDQVVVVAPTGMLTASMRALVRTAVRRGVPVCCWHQVTPASAPVGA